MLYTSGKAKRDLGEMIASISVFLYLLSVLYLFIEENSAMPNRIMGAVCTIEFLWFRFSQTRFKVSIGVTFFVLLCAATGMINYLLIRNSSIVNVVECAVFNAFTACLIIEREMRTKWLEYACYAFFAVFIYRIFKAGLFQRITRFSNNQVSVALLIPVVVYYTIGDVMGEGTSIIPAMVTWILSLLSRGRTGIIVCTALFVAILLRYFFGIDPKSHNGRRSVLKKLVAILVFIIGISAGVYLFSNYSTQILSKFIERGLDNSSRRIIWGEYIANARNNLLYFLLGVPKRILLIGTYFNNNTHNSFISIHANNGIVMFVFCMVLFLNAIRYALKNRYYIYLTCIIVFCMRSFFDNMFWGTWGTTSFMVLIFIPLLAGRRTRSRREVHA